MVKSKEPSESTSLLDKNARGKGKTAEGGSSPVQLQPNGTEKAKSRTSRVVRFICNTMHYTNTNEVLGKIIPYGFTGSSYVALGVASIVLMMKDNGTVMSGICISVFSLLRALGFLVSLLWNDPTWGGVTLTIMGVGAYFCNIYIIVLIPREYFLQEKKQPWQELQKWAMVLLAISCASLSILTISLQPTLWLDNFIKFFLGCMVAVGITVIVVAMFEVQTLAHKGSRMYTVQHTHGLVLFMLLVGMAVRMVFDSVLLFSDTSLLNFLPNPTFEGFENSAKELLTVIIPTGFHLYNVFREKYANHEWFRNRKANPSKRFKIVLILVFLVMNLTVVGFVVHTSSDRPVPIQVARAAAFICARDIACVVLIILAPISQLAYGHFTFGAFHHSIHKLHLHKNIAFSAIFFFCIHVLGHIVMQRIRPNFSVDNIPVYQLTNPAIITGILMVIGYLMAAVTGFWRLHFSYHIPFALLATVCFFFHGSQHLLGPSVGDKLIFIVSLVCVVMVCIFFLVNPVHELTIIRDETTIMGRFLVLTLENNGLTIPPGSYCNIYNEASKFKLFHGHPFSVLSASYGKIKFLIEIRESENMYRPSFTQVLAHKVCQDPKPFTSLFIHGPFLGPASTMLHFLKTSETPISLVLCGRNSGFAPVFSLAEHFRDDIHDYPAIKEVHLVCNFSEKIAAYYDEQIKVLRDHWELYQQVPLLEKRGVLSACEVTATEGMLQVLYYVGLECHMEEALSNFQGWQLFTETLPGPSKHTSPTPSTNTLDILESGQSACSILNAPKYSTPEFDISPRDFQLLNERLPCEVVGQPDAIEEFGEKMLRLHYHQDFLRNPSAPLAFLFAGTPVQGKENLARLLAGALSRHLIQIDLSQHTTPDSVTRLFGAPRDRDGELIEFTRRNPNCIILLSHMEQAHELVQLHIMRILSYGSLKERRYDSQTYVNFSNTIIIMTVDVGSYELSDVVAERIPQDIKLRVMENIHDAVQFPDEVWQHLSVSIFRPVTTRDSIEAHLCKVKFDQMQKGIRIEWTPEVVDVLLRDFCYPYQHNPAALEVELNKYVNRIIRTQLCKHMQKGLFHCFRVVVKNGALEFHAEEEGSSSQVPTTQRRLSSNVSNTLPNIYHIRPKVQAPSSPSLSIGGATM